MYEALLCHLVGDFLLQSDYMAKRKPYDSLVCGLHVLVYTLVFLCITQSLPALALIAGTHFVIDRFRLGIRWCNFYGVGDEWEYDPDQNRFLIPINMPYLSFWLAVIVDQTMHLVCNYLILRYLG